LDIAAGGVLLGNGDGTFQGIPLGATPSAPTYAAIGDFDKNSTIDVAALSDSSLYILSNSGAGKLTLTHTYALQEPGYGIVTADFNGDGNLDLLVVQTNPITQLWGYSILLGNGDGSFQAPVFYPQGAQTAASEYSIVVADFNNDHKMDVAIMPREGGSLEVLLGNGDGTFASPVGYYDRGFPSLVADFNGDGKLDIAAGGFDLASTPLTPRDSDTFRKWRWHFPSRGLPHKPKRFCGHLHGGS